MFSYFFLKNIKINNIFFFFSEKIEFVGRNEKMKRESLPVPLVSNGKLYGIAAVTGKCP